MAKTKKCVASGITENFKQGTQIDTPSFLKVLNEQGENMKVYLKKRFSGEKKESLIAEVVTAK